MFSSSEYISTQERREGEADDIQSLRPRNVELLERIKEEINLVWTVNPAKRFWCESKVTNTLRAEALRSS